LSEKALETLTMHSRSQARTEGANKAREKALMIAAPENLMVEEEAGRGQYRVSWRVMREEEEDLSWR
jgi:hypothetical protein